MVGLSVSIPFLELFASLEHSAIDQPPEPPFLEKGGRTRNRPDSSQEFDFYQSISPRLSLEKLSVIRCSLSVMIPIALFSELKTLRVIDFKLLFS
jgi:hypothetical protein